MTFEENARSRIQSIYQLVALMNIKPLSHSPTPSNPSPTPMKTTFFKYEVITIDEPSVLATIVYDCPSKKLALEAIKAQLGETEAEDMRADLKRMRVVKSKKDGEDFFMWGKNCDFCGQMNKGKWSYVALL